MIAIGCDHGGLEIKNAVIEYMKENGIAYTDYGCNTPDSVDYPVFAYKVAKNVADGSAELGIICCGTGIGVSMAANKVKGIRAVVCSDPYTAKLSKQHNNTNIVAFGARVIGVETAKMIVDEWLNAEFMGGRHAERVALITEIEQTQRLAARGE